MTPFTHCPACQHPVTPPVEECPHCHAPLALQEPPAAASSVDTLWKQARDTFARYDYAAAVTAAQAVLEAAPGHEEATRLKGQAEEKLQTLQAALTLANEYFNKGQYELAVVHFNTVLGLCPTDEANRRKLEMAKLLSGQDLTAYTPKEIRRTTTKWAEEVVPSPVSTMVMAGVIVCGVLYLCAYFYGRAQRRYQTAEELYRLVERRLVTQEYLTGDAETSYKQLTMVYGNTQFAKEAATLFAQTKARHLEQASLQLDQAEQYLLDDRPTLTMEIARDVLRWDPQNSRAQDLFAQAEEALDRLERGYMRTAMKGKPLPESTGATGSVFDDAAWTSAHDEELSPAVEQLVREGQGRFLHSDYERAAAAWEEASRRHGRPHRMLDGLVKRAHELESRRRQRLEEFQARAETFEGNGRTAEALAAYREAQLYQPESAKLQVRINALAAKLPGGGASTAAAPRPPSNAERWRAEAARYEAAGRWQEAIQVYRRWLAAAPTMAAYHELYLTHLIEAGEQRRVSGVWEQVVLAEAHLLKGRQDAARRLLSSVLTHLPKQATGRRAFVLALQGLAAGSFDEALAAYRQSLNVAPLWYVQHQLATQLWEHGRYLEAIQLWEGAHTRWPDQAGIIAELATSYILIDQTERAKALMEPLKRWKMTNLQSTQRHPATIRPDYWLGLVDDADALADVCDATARAWLLLDQPLEALRWRQWAQLQRDARALDEQHLVHLRSWWPWR